MVDVVDDDGTYWSNILMKEKFRRWRRLCNNAMSNVFDFF